MPANHKVSVAWQIVFTFLPIVNLWAFYRIRKLRKYVLYVIVPSIMLSIANGVYSAFIVPVDRRYDFVTLLDASVLVPSLLGLALAGYSIYLVIIWSRLHNLRVDASMGQVPG